MKDYCLICHDDNIDLYLYKLCNSCNYKYCNKCSLKLLHKCSICFRINNYHLDYNFFYIRMFIIISNLMIFITFVLFILSLFYYR